MKLKTFFISLLAVNIFGFLLFIAVYPNFKKEQIQPKYEDTTIQYMQRKGKLTRTGADFKITYIVNINSDSNASKITITNVQDV